MDLHERLTRLQALERHRTSLWLAYEGLGQRMPADEGEERRIKLERARLWAHIGLIDFNIRVETDVSQPGGVS